MSALEIAIEELKALPPSRQDEAARFIHSLKAIEATRRSEIIEKTYGCLSEEEGAEWEAAVAECSHVDHENW